MFFWCRILETPSLVGDRGWEGMDARGMEEGGERKGNKSELRPVLSAELHLPSRTVTALCRWLRRRAKEKRRPGRRLCYLR
jgi:hypothetical protein